MKKKQIIPNKPPKARLILKNYSLWNPRQGFNQKTQIQTNYMSNDEIE
jgi:hypothetical protein